VEEGTPAAPAADAGEGPAGHSTAGDCTAVRVVCLLACRQSTLTMRFSQTQSAAVGIGIR
jgi:hypothetical protein